MYVGVDVSKKTIDVCLPTKKSENGKNEKSLFKYLVYNNNRTDIKRFVATLNGKLLYQIRPKKEGEMEWHVIFENTGLYHKILMKELWQAKIKMSQVSSYNAKQFHKTLNINTKQTDKTDARELLLYGKMYKPKESKWNQENEEIRLLRSVWRQTKKSLTKLKQNKHNITFYYSPQENKNEKLKIEILKKIKKYNKKNQTEKAKNKIVSTITLWEENENKQNEIIKKLKEKSGIELFIKNVENSNIVQMMNAVMQTNEQEVERLEKTLINKLKKIYPLEYDAIMSIP